VTDVAQLLPENGFDMTVAARREPMADGGDFYQWLSRSLLTADRFCGSADRDQSHRSVVESKGECQFRRTPVQQVVHRSSFAGRAFEQVVLDGEEMGSHPGAGAIGVMGGERGEDREVLTV